jgi:hypothetical protein
LNAVLDIENNPDHEFKRFLDGALYWFSFGFDVIPLLPKDKVTAVKWDGWLESLSEAKITDHWTKHPDHEVGFIVGDGLIVFDADTPESTAKLYEIERAFDVFPLLVVKTSKGVHHYFKRSVGVFAKSDSHSTVDHPDRLDVKTGRAMVVLAPSTGKEVDICEVDSADDLTEVDQSAVDAIARHNGRQVPRPQQPREILADTVVLPTTHKMLATILSLLSADCGYEDWLQTMMAIYHETGGSDEGLNLADSWSSNGRSYKGRTEVELKWRSFKSGVENPITVRSLTKKLDDQGIEWMGICSENEDSFEVCEDFVISEVGSETDLTSDKVIESEKVKYVNPFDKFSLRGHSAEIEKNAVEPVYVLEGIAIKGQYTFIFAEPNTGKTLFSLKMIMDGIRDGRIDPNKLYYLNMDDTATGLLEKNRIAEDYGFNMASEGYLDFKAEIFLNGIKELISNNTAKDVVVVLDTAKKFVDVNNKPLSSEFNKVVRPFVGKGGTVIVLAHTNKNLGQNGKPVPGGTSDMRDDCDCAYTLSTVSTEKNVKVVEFENIKRRGNVLNNVSYRYTIEDGSSYEDILFSVEKVGDNDLNAIKQTESVKADAELIDAVKVTINEGINTKEELVKLTAKKVGISRSRMKLLLEKYTGKDPVLHRWTVNIGVRGANIFSLLDPSL